MLLFRHFNKTRINTASRRKPLEWRLHSVLVGPDTFEILLSRSAAEYVVQTSSHKTKTTLSIYNTHLDLSIATNQLFTKDK